MLVSLSVTGIFLSAILLGFHDRHHQASIYLCLFFLLVALYSFNNYILLHSESALLIAYIPRYLGFLCFLIGPMFYWYIRSVLTDNSVLKGHDFWHLLPMVLFLTASIPNMISPASEILGHAAKIVENPKYLLEYKPTFLSEFFTPAAVYLSRPALVLAYSFWSSGLFFLYLFHKKNRKVISSQHFMFKWISLLLLFQLLMGISHLFLVLHFFSEMNVSVVVIKGFQIMALSGLTGLLISPFFFPSILYGLPRLPESSIKIHSQKKEEVKRGTKLYINHFETGYLLSIEQKADFCMQKNQPYLQPDFNLAHLAVLLHIPVHHLAYYFREVKKQHFNDYRNSWRVRHAKMLIENGSATELTIEAIGMLSGFSNRNSFGNTFKKIEGVSPGLYALQHNEKIKQNSVDLH